MNREEYVDMLKARLDEWNEQIGKTEQMMKDATAEAQTLEGDGTPLKELTAEDLRALLS